jgi:dTDP-4-amino-4,6-dideoxygalactose transaminase
MRRQQKAADRQAARKRGGKRAAAARRRRPVAVAGTSQHVPWVRPVFETDATLLRNPYLRELERRLAAYLGVDECVAVASGAAALTLVTTALGVRGAKAALPSFTFIATLNAVLHGGMTPVFCDIEPDTWTLSPTHLRGLIADDPAIRLVVPVNVFGVPPDLPAIARVLHGTDTVLLLDNAHGMGTQVAGALCPPQPAVQTFSFHATKMLPAVEGGAVVGADPQLLAEIRRMRNHGIAADAMLSGFGHNAKLSELHAAVGLRSLQTLDASLARRRRYAERIRRVLGEECGALFAAQRVPEDVRSNFQNLGVRCHLGDGMEIPSIQADLQRDGIETRRYFWPPLHRLAPYRDHWTLPVTDEVFRSLLCLPLHSRMEPHVLDRIETALRRVASGRAA